MNTGPDENGPQAVGQTPPFGRSDDPGGVQRQRATGEHRHATVQVAVMSAGPPPGPQSHGPAGRLGYGIQAQACAMDAGYLSRAIADGSNVGVIFFDMEPVARRVQARFTAQAQPSPTSSEMRAMSR